MPSRVIQGHNRSKEAWQAQSPSNFLIVAEKWLFKVGSEPMTTGQLKYKS